MGAFTSGAATPSSPDWYQLRRATERLALVPGFSELVTLNANTIQELPHQTDVVLRVLSHMGGRAILADEVGLGKTIEAGIILKELTARGLARRVLIITPASLVAQWQGDPAHGRAGHDACSVCVEPCASCATATCELHSQRTGTVDTCPICERDACSSHTEECEHCLRPVCARDVQGGRCHTCRGLEELRDPEDALIRASMDVREDSWGRPLEWRAGRDATHRVASITLSAWRRRLVIVVLPHGSGSADPLRLSVGHGSNVDTAFTGASERWVLRTEAGPNPRADIRGLERSVESRVVHAGHLG